MFCGAYAPPPLSRGVTNKVTIFINKVKIFINKEIFINKMTIFYDDDFY